MKTLCLSTDLQDQIRRHCANSYPSEACGLLIGQRCDQGDHIVTNIVASPNMSDRSEKNFEIDPALIIHHQKEARRGKDKILGHYHSHPDGQARPSVHDQAQNYDADLIWVIVQVTNGVALTLKAFATDPKSGRLRAIPLNQS